MATELLVVAEETQEPSTGHAVDVGGDSQDGAVGASPVEAEEGTGDDAGYFEFLFEPSQLELLKDLLPNHIYIQILEFLYQTAVSEHAARMAAMDNATSNCKEVVRALTLVYNKARQAGITKELMDIVGGAEALKG